MSNGLELYAFHNVSCRPCPSESHCTGRERRSVERTLGLDWLWQQDLVVRDGLKQVPDLELHADYS